MNSFLNPHNATSLTGVTDITAHSVSLFQENEPPQNINDTFIHKSDISVAEPYDIQIGGELGDNVITMYEFIGDINDTKMLGLESILIYMNENFISKDEPAVNDHHYHITRKQYNQYFTTHNIYNVDKSESYKTKNRNFNDNSSYNKKQIITNSLTNYVTKNNNIINNGKVLNVRDFSTKHYITNVFRSNNDYIENILYKEYGSRTFNATENITKHINNYSNDVTNNYKINKINNVKKRIITPMMMLH